MKKLLLTSSGLDNEHVQREFLNLLEKPIEKVRVLFIFGAKNDEEMFYVNESKSELLNLGILDRNIIDANVNDEISFPKGSFDVIYFCGGNTYYLLDRIRELSFDEHIKKGIEKGALYIGVSAGSIIAGKNIEIAGWGSEGDDNSVGLKDLAGLNFTDIAIFPHYEERLKEEVEEFRKIVNYPVKELANGELILIVGDEVREIK